MKTPIPQSNAERVLFLNRKATEVAARQLENLVADYDEALVEYRTKDVPFTIRFRGRLFDIPHSMPFGFSMFYMRHCIVKRGGRTFFEVPDDRVFEFLELMFGKAFVTAMEQSNVETTFVMQRIVPDIMDKWGLRTRGEGPQAETPAS